MKKIILLALLAACVDGALAQSQSFKALQDTFAEQESVQCFKASGFLVRTALWFAGEREFKRAIRNVKNVRIITVPKTAFREKKVTVRGFHKIVRRDAYEEVASIREANEMVSVYLQNDKNSRNNRYLILIDNARELVALEMRGYVDPELFENRALPFSKL